MVPPISVRRSCLMNTISSQCQANLIPSIYDTVVKKYDDFGVKRSRIFRLQSSEQRGGSVESAQSSAPGPVLPLAFAMKQRVRPRYE